MIVIKKSYIKLLILEIVLTLIVVLNIVVFNISNLYYLSTCLLVTIGVIKLLVGYEKDRNRYKKDAVMSIFIYVMLYFIIIYLLGIFTGFLLSPYSFTIFNIIRNITPVILIILTSEILRYSIVRKGEKNNWIIVLSIIFFVLLDISIISYNYDLGNTIDVIEILTLVFIQSVSTNIMLTYSTTKFGFLPSIVYRILLEISVFILPIIPNFGQYIHAILEFVLPIIVLYLLYSWYQKKLVKKEDKINLKNPGVNKGLTIVTVIFIVVMVYLTSGFFKYYALSIGSESMESEIYKGDVVIVEKTDDYDKLQIGDVLVYEKEKIVVVHRIIEIMNDGEVYSYITKGDNNEDADNWIVTENQIIGKVIFKVKYVGYPTVWLSEIVN